VPCTVLDPFGGAGTTGLVADRLQRNAILIELNPEYAAMASNRIANDAGGLFATVDVQKPTDQQMSLLEAAE
jgi:DNA modification methylase